MEKSMIAQDVVVALKLLESPQWPGFTPLSQALGMSLSQVHRSVARLSDSRLFVESEQTVQRANLLRFVIHGLPFAFPARLGEIVRGVPTAWACPELKDTKLSTLLDDDLAPVWPNNDGKIKGRAIEPLHAAVPMAVRTDKRLYALLALIDVLRVGRAREREFAEAELQKRIAHVRS
jgi:hypothetical protein